MPCELGVQGSAAPTPRRRRALSALRSALCELAPARSVADVFGCGVQALPVGRAEPGNSRALSESTSANTAPSMQCAYIHRYVVRGAAGAVTGRRPRQVPAFLFRFARRLPSAVCRLPAAPRPLRSVAPSNREAQHAVYVGQCLYLYSGGRTNRNSTEGLLRGHGGRPSECGRSIDQTNQCRMRDAAPPTHAAVAAGRVVRGRDAVARRARAMQLPSQPASQQPARNRTRRPQCTELERATAGDWPVAGPCGGRRASVETAGDIATPARCGETACRRPAHLRLLRGTPPPPPPCPCCPGRSSSVPSAFGSCVAAWSRMDACRYVCCTVGFSRTSALLDGERDTSLHT